MTIYERIKQLRIEKGMSQLDLAHAVGYQGRSAISKVENGERDISQSMIEKYASALGVSPAFLMYGEKSEPRSTDLSPLDKEIIRLFALLTDDEKKLVTAQIKGILSSR